MKRLITWLAGIFEARPHGASARKLTAFSCVAFAAYCHRWLNFENATTFLLIDLITVLVALGIVTMEQIISLKNGNNHKKD